MIKWLVQLGVGGVVGGIALWQLERFGKATVKAAEKTNEWLMAIHTRLSTLGADSVPPPIVDTPPPRPVRQRKHARILTVPTGFAVSDAPDDE